MAGMIFGAAKGLVTGEDPIMGAAMGGLTGALPVVAEAVAPTVAGAVVPEVAGAAGAAASGLTSAADLGAAGIGSTGYWLGNVAPAAASAAAPTATGIASAAPAFQSAGFWGSPTGIATPAAAVGAAPAPAFQSTGFWGSPTADAAKNVVSGQGINTAVEGAVPAAVEEAAKPGMLDRLKNWYGDLSDMEKLGVGAAGGAGIYALMGGLGGMPEEVGTEPSYRFNRRKFRRSRPFADGGITSLAGDFGNPVIQVPAQPQMGAPYNDTYNNQSNSYNNSYNNTPAAGYLGNSVKMMADGGVSNLGGYSDGGQLLSGPGDGVSDSIPASIEGRQPARLAAGEFVVPARIVSELGNGSTDAGAARLYSMVDNVAQSRRASMGKDAIAKDTKAYKHLLA